MCVKGLSRTFAIFAVYTLSSKLQSRTSLYTGSSIIFASRSRGCGWGGGGDLQGDAGGCREMGEEGVGTRCRCPGEGRAGGGGKSDFRAGLSKLPLRTPVTAGGHWNTALCRETRPQRDRTKRGKSAEDQKAGSGRGSRASNPRIPGWNRMRPGINQS